MYWPFCALFQDRVSAKTDVRTITWLMVANAHNTVPLDQKNLNRNVIFDIGFLGFLEPNQRGFVSNYTTNEIKSISPALHCVVWGPDDACPVPWPFSTTVLQKNGRWAFSWLLV